MQQMDTTELNAEKIFRDVIAIGGSAGGIQPLLRILGRLPVDLPAAIVVTLHRSASGHTTLSRVLGRHVLLPVVEPEDGARLHRGVVYVAPADRHMVLEGGVVRLTDGPKEHHCRPAIDPLFRSASAAYGPRVAGVLLSGLGFDGVAGLRAIKSAGGLCFVMRPEEADYPALPTNAITYAHVDAILRLIEIPELFRELADGNVISEPNGLRAASTSDSLGPLSGEGR